MNWKTKVLIPLLKALGLTLIVLAMLLSLCAAMTAYKIWGLDQYNPKWGGKWGDFQFGMAIYSAILGIQCGILLVGNAISAVFSGKAFRRIAVIPSVIFAVIDGVMIALKTDPTNKLFLLGLPGICAAIILIGTAIKKGRHKSRH